MSQIKATRYTGDQFYIDVQLNSVDSNGVSTPVDVSSATTIKAGLINDGTLAISAPNLVAGTTGADWANGLVVAIFASSDTAGLDPNKTYFIQIRVEDGITPAPQTFQAGNIEIARGYIS